MESLSEFGLRLFLEGLSYLNVKNTEQVPHPPFTAGSVFEVFGTKIEFNKEIGLQIFQYFVLALKNFCSDMFT
jgi:hypothetical protein